MGRPPEMVPSSEVRVLYPDQKKVRWLKLRAADRECSRLWKGVEWMRRYSWDTSGIYGSAAEAMSKWQAADKRRKEARAHNGETQE